MKLRPLEYELKQGDGKTNFGFLAQDIETLVGTHNSILTIGADKDRTLGLRYTDFIAPIVKGMQEQQKKIEFQQKQAESQQKLILELQKTNAELIQRIEKLESK